MRFQSRIYKSWMSFIREAEKKSSLFSGPATKAAGLVALFFVGIFFSRALKKVFARCTVVVGLNCPFLEKKNF